MPPKAQCFGPKPTYDDLERRLVEQQVEIQSLLKILDTEKAAKERILASTDAVAVKRAEARASEAEARAKRAEEQVTNLVSAISTLAMRV